MIKLFKLIIFCVSISMGQNIQMIFLGVDSHDIPEYEVRLEQLLRESFSVMAGVEMSDYSTIEFIKHRTNFGYEPKLSRAMIETVQRFATSDKTLIVWAKVQKLSVQQKTSWLIFNSIHGLMQMSVTIYSPSFRDFAVCNDVISEATIDKTPELSQGASSTATVSLQDRANIMDALLAQSVSHTSTLLSGIVRSRLSKPIETTQPSDEQKNGSVMSDLFEIPAQQIPTPQTQQSNKPRQ